MHHRHRRGKAQCMSTPGDALSSAQHQAPPIMLRWADARESVPCAHRAALVTMNCRFRGGGACARQAGIHRHTAVDFITSRVGGTARAKPRITGHIVVRVTTRKGGSRTFTVVPPRRAGGSDHGFHEKSFQVSTKHSDTTTPRTHNIPRPVDSVDYSTSPSYKTQHTHVRSAG